MKRILSATMILILLFCSFACHTDSNPAQDPSPVADAETPTPKPTEAPTPEPTPEPTKSPAEYWAELDRQYPALLAALSKKTLRAGIWDPSAFDIDISLLPEFAYGSEEECQRYYEDLRALLNRVTEIDRFKLDDSDLFAFNTVTESLKSNLRRQEYILYDQPFLPGNGWHLKLLNEFYGFRINSTDDIESYLEAISEIPTILEKLLAREQTRIENNLFMTEYALNRVLTEIDYVRLAEKSFFGYAYLGKCMDALGMSAEEQEPYLVRNETAVDAVLSAYDDLYKALDGMRSHCEDPDTIYIGAPSVENNALYVAYLAQLSQVLGVQLQRGPVELFQFYDCALAIMETEFTSVEFPSQFEGGSGAVLPITAESIYKDTMQLLEEKYGALDFSPSIKYLPNLDVPFLGSMQMRYYYDKPNASILYFNPESTLSSAAMQYATCNNYFYLRFLQQKDLSRAQILSAPDTYYSGLGFYTALSLTKEKAESSGRYIDYANYYTLFMIVYQYMLTAYTANLIRLGYPIETITQNLTQTFGFDETAARSLIDEARADPITMISVTYGLARLIILREACSQKLKTRFDEQSFINEYISYGPTFPDMIEDKISVWCENLAASYDL